MQENVIVPEGNIKVNAEELKRVMDITEKLINNVEINKTENDYFVYFQRKYIELPALRLQEQSMYSFYKRANLVAVSEKDLQGAAEIEGNYRELREKRIELQKELEKENEKYGLSNELFKERSPTNQRNR